MFVLSGEESTLTFAETRALIQTYSDGAAFQTENRRVVLSNLSDDLLVQKISERGSYCRFGGILVAKLNNIDEISEKLSPGDLKSIIKERTFAVNSFSVDMAACGEVGQKIKSITGAKVDLENPDCVFQFESTGSTYVLGVAQSGYKRFSWKTRRPRARRFFLPSAIYPKLARVLVNLSRVKEKEVFLDPFCGTGSLLIEGSLMGMKSIGIDLKRWIARGALLNMKGFTLDYEGILQADSSYLHFPFRSINAISTDVPYGRASSTLGKSTSEITSEFLVSASDALCKKGYCVVMHPDSVKLNENTRNFELIEEHFLYVHRSLTRAISVLRRR